ncbi:unnamed protein product [Prorocentrum cordatum]|uniref:PH domain-containing protein n=1 Tax=Prorocentrum cordatum TaxID=2364126 RepID=A0ABN9XQ98_9DINO|nr:unnamed protein product [Polarella glacialis]
MLDPMDAFRAGHPRGAAPCPWRLRLRGPDLEPEPVGVEAVSRPSGKVKADGDRMNPPDWYERDMWLNADGDLVYFSKRDGRKLIYYTADDVHSAQIFRLSREQACRPWAFQLRLPAHDGLEFAPGEFAAASEAQRESWIQEFVRFGAAVQQDGAAPTLL